MSRSPFAKWMSGVFGASTRSLRRERRRFRPGSPVGAESLEGRELLATVTVHLVNFAFNPITETIHVGDTVHLVGRERIGCQPAQREDADDPARR